MFKSIFGADPIAPEQLQTELSGADKEIMEDILCAATTMFPFKIADAKIAVSYMSPRIYSEREIIVEEGGKDNLDFMLWLLDGEVSFEGLAGGGASQPVTVTVLGAGSAIGIMSMIDGGPRSLRGVATETTRCAKLTRAQLQNLCRDHPQVGIKLMAVLCLVFSQSLRNLTTKFKCHVRLNNALNAELRGRDESGL